MLTETIRETVREMALSANRIWPNGLGFTARGWEYTHGDRGWAASRTDDRGTAWLGRGETPADARANAYPQPD